MDDNDLTDEEILAMWEKAVAVTVHRIARKRAADLLSPMLSDPTTRSITIRLEDLKDGLGL